jgi:hypothetical protein
MLTPEGPAAVFQITNLRKAPDVSGNTKLSKMLNWLRNIFFRPKTVKIEWKRTRNIKHYRPVNEISYVWCLVGNIINEHYYGENLEVRRGSKHFSPNTKVYCFPPMWGDGYENIKVIGRHRKSKKFITLVMQSELITNWRLEKVYSPYIIKELYGNKVWTDLEEDRETILQMLTWLPKVTKTPPEKS